MVLVAEPSGARGTSAFVSLLFAGGSSKPIRTISLDGTVSLTSHSAPQSRSISTGGAPAIRPRSSRHWEESKEGQLPVGRVKQSQGKDDTNDDDEMPGRAYLDMADARVALGDWTEVILLWNKALQLQTKRGTANHRAAISETLARRGKHLASINMSLDAVRDLEKAARLKTVLCESKPSKKLSLDIADTLVHLSQAQDHLNLYVESRQSLDDALARRKQALGEDHVLVAEIHYQIAKSYHRRKRYSEARISYGQALDVYRKLGIRHDDPTFSRIRRCAADRNIAGSIFWEIAASFSADI